MNNSDTVIDEGSITEYVRDYHIFDNLVEIVQRAQDENPGLRALALGPVNIERTIDDLKARGIITIGSLDKILKDNKAAILRVLNQQESAYIASRHVYTPIYILLENISTE